MRPAWWKSALQIAGFVLLCQAAGALGALTTETGAGSWYQALEKPFFNPPGWVFGPVWLTLYTLMGVAAWRVWRRGTGHAPVRAALAWFAAQLALNALWTPVFFGAEAAGWGLVVIVALLGAVLVTVWRFAVVDRPAAWLLVPYALWVAFATALNAAIWWLNR